MLDAVAALSRLLVIEFAVVVAAVLVATVPAAVVRLQRVFLVMVAPPSVYVMLAPGAALFASARFVNVVVPQLTAVASSAPATVCEGSLNVIVFVAARSEELLKENKADVAAELPPAVPTERLLLLN